MAGTVETSAQGQLARVPADMAGARVDQALAALFPGYSRARLQRWIREGRATLDARQVRPKDRVRGGERVELRPESAPEPAWRPQALPLPIVHADEDILVVNKPAGLVVHPGAGVPDGTLVNALLHHDPALAGVPRAGVVHRLDKDTTGLLVVARHLGAHKHLVDALKRRRVHREYEALVWGVLSAGGRVEAPIGRHRGERTRMAIVPSGRTALTHYRVRARFRAHTHLALVLESGRTHQIRVHMAHLGHPVVGDPVYGRRRRGGAGAPAGAAAQEAVQRFPRQALHASRLELPHPRDGRRVRFDAPLPADMAELLETLERERAHATAGR